MSEEQQESTEVATHTPASTQTIQTYAGRGLNLTTFDEMWRFAKAVAASGLAPKDMQKPETLLVAIEMGLEVGLTPMQAIQNIAVINGRPGLWGDAIPGLVRSSGHQEYYKQEKIGTPSTDGYGYKVTSKRKGDPNPIETTFTVADAKKASLWTKAGPWTFYPDRMLLNRARAFNARDNFPDVLKGMRTAEEIMDTDFEVLDSTPLADGDKTNRLAEKLTKKEEVEKVIEVMEEAAYPPISDTAAFVEQVEKATQERILNGPPLVDGDVIKAEPHQSPQESPQESRPNDTLPTGQVKAGKASYILKKLELREISMPDLRRVTKELGIKFGIPQNLTEEEAGRILEKL